MPRFAESVYYINLGSGTRAEVSLTGDHTIWAHFHPGGLVHLERIGDRDGKLAVTHRATLSQAQAACLQALLQDLPAPQHFPASGCDGLHLKLIVSDLHHTRLYTWWEADRHQPAIKPLADVVALLEAAC